MLGDTPHCQSLNSTEDNLVAILRDIAEGKQNLLGEQWSLSFCNDAADLIEKLLKKN